MANNGIGGVILVTSEIPEIIGLCDRVMVMHRGKMIEILEKEEISPERILKAGTGGLIENV